MEEIRDNDLALKKAKKSQNKDDWIIARQLKNACLTHVRKAKCGFVKNWGDFDVETNPNKLWDIFHTNVLTTLDSLYPTNKFSVKK